MYCKFIIPYVTAIQRRKNDKDITNMMLVIIQIGSFYKVLDTYKVKDDVSIKIEIDKDNIAYVRKDEVELITDEEYMLECL